MGNYQIQELNYMGDCFNEASFDEFYKDYYKKIYNFIYFKTGSTMLSEDLTGVVMEKVTRNLETFDEMKSNLNTWIFTIARNSIIDYFRSKKSTESYFAEGEELNIVDEVTEKAENYVLQKELSETVNGLLAQVGEVEREIIILKFWGGLKNVEIAEQLGMTGNSVNVMVFRTLKKLKAIADESGVEL